jgi:hypothetical protein
VRRAIANNSDIGGEVSPERRELNVAELKGFSQPILTSTRPAELDAHAGLERLLRRRFRET